jgi:hypothetical protein
VPAPKPAAAAASPSPPARPAPEPADEEDVLKQTQTLRAIAAARSIDDISSSMAETLFGDAEVDLLTAALAAAAGWSEEESAPTPTPAPAAAAPPKPTAKGATKPAASPAPEGEDDLLDLLGLGDGAPLELIDDTAPAGGDRGRKAS